MSTPMSTHMPPTLVRLTVVCLFLAFILLHPSSPSVIQTKRDGRDQQEHVGTKPNLAAHKELCPVGICCVYTRNPPSRVWSVRPWLVTPEWRSLLKAQGHLPLYAERKTLPGPPCKQGGSTRFIRKTLHHYPLPPPPSIFLYASPA